MELGEEERVDGGVVVDMVFDVVVDVEGLEVGRREKVVGRGERWRGERPRVWAIVVMVSELWSVVVVVEIAFVKELIVVVS